MPDIIIPDTSSLIFLEKIRKIELLQKLYDRTVVTREVAEEYISPLKQWIEIEKVQGQRYQKVLEQSVDSGEASHAIAGAILLPVQSGSRLLAVLIYFSLYDV